MGEEEGFFSAYIFPFLCAPCKNGVGTTINFYTLLFFSSVGPLTFCSDKCVYFDRRYDRHIPQQPVK